MSLSAALSHRLPRPLYEYIESSGDCQLVQMKIFYQFSRRSIRSYF
jgi:hypothetical protein